MVTTEQVMEVHHEACYVLRNAFVRVDTTVRAHEGVAQHVARKGGGPAARVPLRQAGKG